MSALQLAVQVWQLPLLFSRNARFFKVLSDVGAECCFMVWRQVRGSRGQEQDAVIAEATELICNGKVYKIPGSDALPFNRSNLTFACLAFVNLMCG